MHDSPEFYVGQIVVHKLTKEKVLIIKDTSCYDKSYKVRLSSYTVIDVAGEELEETN